MACDTTLRVGTIHVIESLPETEYCSGRLLYDRLLAPAYKQRDHPAANYLQVPDRQRLLETLARIASHVEEFRYRAILHLEAHGSADGFETASGEAVPWGDLRELLTRISRATGLHLTVVLSMCEGWWITRMLRPDSPAPAFAVIGPTSQASGEELFNTYEALYQEIIYRGEHADVFRALNGTLPPQQWRFRVAFAWQVFAESFTRYTETCTDEVLRARENDLVAALVRSRSLNLLESADAREYARGLLRDQRAFFEYAKAGFFMFEAFPDNRARFPLTFDECLSPRFGHAHGNLPAV